LVDGAGARAQAPFCDRLKALTQDPAVAQAHWGISVTTLDGRPLCTLNPSQLFRPASNAKLFTSVAALALLGPERTFSTAILSSEPAAPTLHGDLTLRGDGDAFLSARPMPYRPPSQVQATALTPRNPLEDLADEVARAGVRHITGDIVGDDSAWPFEPYPSDWSLEDTVWGYGAPISALSVDDNKLALALLPAATPGDPPGASLVPATGLYQFQIDARTVAEGKPFRIGLEKQPGARVIRIFGTLAQGKTYTDDLAVDDPAEYAALTFKSLLESRGIVVDGRARAAHRPQTNPESLEAQVKQPLAFQPLPSTPSPALPSPPQCPACPSIANLVVARHTSPPLIDDITLTLKVSQNLHAELLLHHLAETFGADGSTAQGVRVVRQCALDAGVLPTDLFLYDGSGLSGHDLVTPRALTQLLAFAARQTWFTAFKAALPVGGVDGSLAAHFTGPLAGRVQAKTGTLGESRALSGYVTASGGATLIFSILVDNHPPGSTADRTTTEKIVGLIAAQN
jgi:D-alanyl-D-alanine carboxypeptidase/D-alanyl-D-alanine-endopeptidase (penicillin-binding protein 4)